MILIILHATLAVHYLFSGELMAMQVLGERHSGVLKAVSQYSRLRSALFDSELQSSPSALTVYHLLKVVDRLLLGEINSLLYSTDRERVKPPGMLTRPLRDKSGTKTEKAGPRKDSEYNVVDALVQGLGHAYQGTEVGTEVGHLLAHGSSFVQMYVHDQDRDKVLQLCENTRWHKREG